MGKPSHKEAQSTAPARHSGLTEGRTWKRDWAHGAKLGDRILLPAVQGPGGQERNQMDKDESKVLQWIHSHPKKHGSPGQALLLANIYSVGAASCWLTASSACLQSLSPGITQLSSPAKGEGSTELLLHTPLEPRFKDKYYLPSDVLTIF